MTEPVKPKEKSPSTPSRITYTREFLLNCSRSPIAQQSLPNWWNIARNFPCIARKVRTFDDYSSLLPPSCHPVPSIDPFVPPPAKADLDLPTDTQEHLIQAEPPGRNDALPTLVDSDNEIEQHKSILLAPLEKKKKKLTFSKPKKSCRYLRTCDFDSWDPDNMY